MTQADLDEVVGLSGDGAAEGWDRAAFASELENAVARPWVLTDNGVVVAYLMTWRVVDEVQVLHVATAPAARRRGHARHLLTTVLASEHADGAGGATLEVRASNGPARGLYSGLGFTEVGLRRRYYQDGEDAVLMTLVLEAA